MFLVFPVTSTEVLRLLFYFLFVSSIICKFKICSYSSRRKYKQHLVDEVGRAGHPVNKGSVV